MKVIEQNTWNRSVLKITWDDAPTPPPREQTMQASGVCFTNTGQIILVGSGDGVWSLPGGHPEAGETVETAFRREVLEEACAVVEECGYLGAQRVDDLADSDIMPYYQAHFWARVRLLPFEPQHETTERELVGPEAFVATLNGNTSQIAQAILEAAMRKLSDEAI